jgi:hypothetical protein
MYFTPKIKARPIACGILAITAAGLIGWVSHLIPSPAPIVAKQEVFAEPSSLQRIDQLQNVPAGESVRARGLEMIRRPYYQPISAWYKNKGWWRRNAPIVGGAGGGALIGGLAGGGKGALIGGLAGGGGGYLYKHLRQRHDQRHHSVKHRNR